MSKKTIVVFFNSDSKTLLKFGSALFEGANPRFFGKALREEALYGKFRYGKELREKLLCGNALRGKALRRYAIRAETLCSKALCGKALRRTGVSLCCAVRWRALQHCAVWRCVIR